MDCDAFPTDVLHIIRDYLVVCHVCGRVPNRFLIQAMYEMDHMNNKAIGRFNRTVLYGKCYGRECNGTARKPMTIYYALNFDRKGEINQFQYDRSSVRVLKPRLFVNAYGALVMERKVVMLENCPKYYVKEGRTYDVNKQQVTQDLDGRGSDMAISIISQKRPRNGEDFKFIFKKMVQWVPFKLMVKCSCGRVMMKHHRHCADCTESQFIH